MQPRDYDAEIEHVNDLISQGIKKAPGDYETEFEEAIEQWRGRYNVQEDDAIMLLLQLFRIHQDHWDGIRQRDTMGTLKFREMVSDQAENMRRFQESVKTVTYHLREREEKTKCQAVIDGIGTATGLFFLIVLGILVGIALAKFVP